MAQKLRRPLGRDEKVYVGGTGVWSLENPKMDDVISEPSLSYCVSRVRSNDTVKAR